MLLKALLTLLSLLRCWRWIEHLVTISWKRFWRRRRTRISSKTSFRWLDWLIEIGWCPSTTIGYNWQRELVSRSKGAWLALVLSSQVWVAQPITEWVISRIPRSEIPRLTPASSEHRRQDSLYRTQAKALGDPINQLHQLIKVKPHHWRQ